MKEKRNYITLNYEKRKEKQSHRFLNFIVNDILWGIKSISNTRIYHITSLKRALNFQDARIDVAKKKKWRRPALAIYRPLYSVPFFLCRSLESLGALPCKMRIQANDDVYETTRHRMAVAEENNKNKW